MLMHRSRGTFLVYRSFQPLTRSLPFRPPLLNEIVSSSSVEIPFYNIGLCLFSRSLLKEAKSSDSGSKQQTNVSTTSRNLGGEAPSMHFGVACGTSSAGNLPPQCGDVTNNTNDDSRSATESALSSDGPTTSTASAVELTSSIVVFSTNIDTTGSDVASAKTKFGDVMVSGGIPSIINSKHNISTEERLLELCAELEERRVERHKKMFDDMIVFEGGALSDCISLGTHIIMRDFIQFALYHKKWGYYPKLFRKYRQLMTTGYFDPIPFTSLRSQHDYQAYVAKIHESTPGFVTPTQLFQPVYGWVIAEYLVTTYRAKFDPREPLVVYDVGAGTGALALAVLDYLAEHFPAEYARCEYHAIEMNPYLVQVLRNKLIQHYHHVHIHLISILNWCVMEKRRCMVLAIELFSILPHDCILWDGEGVCNEHWFEFQQEGNLATARERYYAVKDPIILRYLRYLGWMQEETCHTVSGLGMRGGRETLPPPPFRSLEPNINDSIHVMISKMLWIHSPLRTAWLPTAQMLILETLAAFFPRHHLLAADWSSVRQALPGFNGPVLQVKMRVARELYLRRPVHSFHSNAGMVDISFPTDFDHLQRVYRGICGTEKEISSQTHPNFWRIHGGDKTSLFTTKTGFNPLLEDFVPFQVFSTHHPPEL